MENQHTQMMMMVSMEKQQSWRAQQSRFSGEHGLKLRDEDLEARTRSRARSGQSRLTASKLLDQALAERRLFSQPLARPLGIHA